MSEKPIIDVCTCKEATLQRYVLRNLLHMIDPDPEFSLLPGKGAEQVHIGNYIIDYLSFNKALGLTIVEFKVNASLTALTQLLVYPRAVRIALGEAGKQIRFRTILVTTFLDKGFVDVMRVLNPSYPVFFRLCVQDHTGVRLIDPESYVPTKGSTQYWDQVTDSWNGKPKKCGLSYSAGCVVINNKKIELGTT